MLTWAAAALTIAVANPRVEFLVQDRGRFTMELFADQAPKTAAHVLEITEKGFFNGILLHRRVEGFVLQSGDSKSRGWFPEDAAARPGLMSATQGLGDGGSGQTVPFEKGAGHHARGTVGMALESPGDNSGDSQWFINLAENTRLDGKYCVFGKVVKGMDVVDKAKRGDLIVWARVVK
ncbi:MAG: peptidylprolyl isomerase [Fimbriimonadaceae bacterium]|nr:peptidylprolyl isomerase [Fimbriimonadaceae bacterium]